MTDDREGDDEGGKERAVVEEAIDNLYEKRASTREAAYSSLIRALRSRVCRDAIEDKWETMADFVVRSCRRGAHSEVRAAAEMSEVLSATLGPNQRFYETIAPPLISLCNEVADPAPGTSASAPTPEPAAAATAAVIRALGTACFFTSTEPQDALHCLDLMKSLFRARIAPAVSAAVSSWSLLQTLDSAWKNNHSGGDSPSPSSENGRILMALLEHPDVDVRVEAGHALALVFDHLREERGGMGSEETGESPLVLGDCRDWVNADRLGALFGELSCGTAHAKRDRVKEQPAFKTILRSIEDGEPPEETLTVKFQKVRFSGWCDMIRLFQLRRVLATGLQPHLESSDVLEGMFDLGIDRSATKRKMTRVEKRLERSPCSAAAKAHDRQLHRTRDARSAYKSQILDDP